MVCIYCSGDTQVGNSRHQKRSNSVWRRRTCKECQSTFTTLEQAELRSSVMVRSGRNITPLERDSLLITIYDSCKHRPKALEDASSLTNTIIGDILTHTNADGTIEHQKVHEITKTVLQRFDPVAATIYSAYQK